MGLSRESGIPLYRQLADQLVRLIRHGDLKAGSRLSIRELAKKHNISKGVAETAVEILKDEGYLEARPRSGTFVSQNAWNLLLNGKSTDWHFYSSRGFHLANREILFELNNRSSDHTKLQASSYNFYEPDFDPYAPVSRALAILNSKEYLSMLNLHDKRGLPFLREAIVKHILKYGIKTSAENVIMFNGYHEALTSIFHAFLFHGSDIFMAENDIIASMATISEAGGNIRKVAMDRCGPLTEDLCAKITPKRHGLLYINPVNHFPTGITVSARRRRELLEEIEKRHIPVIENDMLRDIASDAPPPFKADDLNGQIIYIGTFANTFLSAFKTAYVVVPAAITERICDVKEEHFSRTNTVLELLAYLMLVHGKYDECMENIRIKIDMRLPLIDEILQKHMSDIAYWDKECLRYHVWLKFIPEIDTERLFMDCPGIFFVPGSTCHNKQHILLNSVCTSVEDFETAVRRIASAARRQLN
jgi:GntR family transcriptional regulator of abcA and norABC